MELPSALLSSSLEKIKKIYPEIFFYISWNETFKLEKFLLFRDIELSRSNVKKRLIYSYISGNKNPKKLLIFWEMELLSPSSKK